MASVQLPRMEQNMGNMDRIIRGAVGGMLLMNGMMTHRATFMSKIKTLVGSAFMFYGLTGFDPLLKAMNVTTKPGDEKNVVNKVKTQSQNSQPGVMGDRTVNNMAGLGV